MNNCSLMSFCKKFHKDRDGGFICFNPIHYLNNMCDFFKGASKRGKPQAIHVDAKSMEEQMIKNKKHRKEVNKRIRKRSKTIESKV